MKNTRNRSAGTVGTGQFVLFFFVVDFGRYLRLCGAEVDDVEGNWRVTGFATHTAWGAGIAWHWKGGQAGPFLVFDFAVYARYDSAEMTCELVDRRGCLRLCGPAHTACQLRTWVSARAQWRHRNLRPLLPTRNGAPNPAARHGPPQGTQRNGPDMDHLRALRETDPTWTTPGYSAKRARTWPRH
eukprot:3632817-Rhodomonas_salina.1